MGNFQSLFHTLKKNFIPLYNNFIPCENFFCYILCFHFIPSTSISYPEHGISYQVAKFSYPTQPISYSSHFPLISLPDSLYVYIHLQLKELVMFADASYDQIMLLSLHPTSISVACLNCQFWDTHKFLRVHHV